MTDDETPVLPSDEGAPDPDAPDQSTAGSPGDEDGGGNGDGGGDGDEDGGGDGRSSGRRRFIVGILAGVVALGGGATALIVGGGGSCPSGGAVLEADGRPVSEEELSRRAELVEALYGLQPPEEGPKADSYRRELAKSMATALIVEGEAKRRKIVVADRAVRDALDRYIADSFPEGGRNRFVEAMGNKGVSEADVLGEFRQIQTTFRLLDAAAGDITVTDAEVAAAYDKRKDEMVLPEQRRLRHLVVGNEAEAAAALARLGRGEAFAAVAAAVSLDATTKAQGGELGLRAAADLEEPFRQAAFTASTGRPFGPVQTRFGWHVGLVETIVSGRPLTREEATAPLREQLVAERKLAAQRKYVARILADADVCYTDRFRPADPDAPPPEITETPVPSSTTSSGPAPGR